jgi:hypothetical protein
MQFKKHLVLFLAFLLLVSNSGLAFNVHYCGDKIAAISSVFFKEEVCEVKVEDAKACCAKVETNHKKCCSDKEVNLDDDTEKIIIKSFSFDNDTPFVFNPWQPIGFFTTIEDIREQHIAYYCEAHAPPLYQLYSQYIFYA